MSWLFILCTYLVVKKPELEHSRQNGGNLKIAPWNLLTKKQYYVNGSVNIRYDSKMMTSLINLLLQLKSFYICREGTMARKCKLDFVLQLGICLSIPLYIEIVTDWLLMYRDWISNDADISPIHKQSNLMFETCKQRSDQKKPGSKQCYV